MWNIFKKKTEKPLTTFSLRFKITYKLAGGKERSTGSILISVPATSKGEAIGKLRRFAMRKVDIEVINI